MFAFSVVVSPHVSVIDVHIYIASLPAGASLPPGGQTPLLSQWDLGRGYPTMFIKWLLGILFRLSCVILVARLFYMYAIIIIIMTFMMALFNPPTPDHTL